MEAAFFFQQIADVYDLALLSCPFEWGTFYAGFASPDFFTEEIGDS